MFRESVLLQKFILNDLGDLKSSFLWLIERVFTYKLYDFNKIVLFLKDGLDCFLVSHELWIPSIIIFLQVVTVVRIRDVPIN